MNSHQNPFAGNTPQDVTERQGENAIFIVYKLNQSSDSVEKVKDVCANFSALIRSMRNRFPDAQFSSTISFGADVWDRIFQIKVSPKNWKFLRKSREVNKQQYLPLVIYCSISALNKWGYVTSFPLLLTKS